MSYRILVTGSRSWSDRGAIAVAIGDAVPQELVEYSPGMRGQKLIRWDQVTIVDGGCPTGADRIAHEIALKVGAHSERHFADWAKYGKAAGPRRNQQMADAGADVCLAFPLGDSYGTRDCMTKARKAGIPVISYEQESP